VATRRHPAVDVIPDRSAELEPGRRDLDAVLAGPRHPLAPSPPHALDRRLGVLLAEIEHNVMGAFWG
jgi:hypothetical protein